MSKPELHAATNKLVVYVGKKRPKVDLTFNTRLRFEPGQAHLLSSVVADQMLKFPDVYVLAHSPEHKAWIEANPLDAERHGWIELPADEVKELEDAEKAAADAAAKLAEEEQDNGMIIAPKSDADEEDPLVIEAHFSEVAQTLNSLPNMPAILEWAKEQALDVDPKDLKRGDLEAAVLVAYKSKYPKGQ